MSGAEVAQDESISYFLSNHLQATGITNDALTGASNDRIYDTTIEYLKLNNPDFVVIGWSDAGRFQMFNDQDGLVYEVNAIGVGLERVPEYYLNVVEQVRDKMSLHGSFAKEMSWYWHNKIHNLHRYLKYRGIRHLFFNAFEIFSQIEDKYRVDWDGCYLMPYTNGGNYTGWCLNQNFNQKTEGHYHFDRVGQQAWADLMYDYILKNNL